MTWVIGRAGPFGYSMGISDIRITLSDGKEIDCLQKIYKIASTLVLGFAGSVAIGLKIIEIVTAALETTDERPLWDPEKIANFFPLGTREIFERADPKQRKLGCELLLFSAHPVLNDGAAPWAKCFVYKFEAPYFRPTVNKGWEIVSIGSGSKAKPYIKKLQSLKDDTRLFNLEMGYRGGAALGLMSSISTTINKNPVKGISSHLHLCMVGRDELRFWKNDIIYPDNLERNFIMPPVARSMEELNEILSCTGIEKSAIEQAKC